MYSAFRYQVKAGNAPDVYGATIDFTEIVGGAVQNATSKFLDITIWDNPAELAFSYDSVNFGDNFEVDHEDPPLQIPFACRAFVIRNKTPGSIARYQVTGFW
jgi:hypothetical protein